MEFRSVFQIILKNVKTRCLSGGELTSKLVGGLRILLFGLTIFPLAWALEIAIFDQPQESPVALNRLVDILFFQESHFGDLFFEILAACVFAALSTLTMRALQWKYRLFFAVVLFAYPLLIAFIFFVGVNPGA
jgi:hypothetical protein